MELPLTVRFKQLKVTSKESVGVYRQAGSLLLITIKEPISKLYLDQNKIRFSVFVFGNKNKLCMFS